MVRYCFGVLSPGLLDLYIIFFICLFLVCWHLYEFMLVLSLCFRAANYRLLSGCFSDFLCVFVLFCRFRNYYSYLQCNGVMPRVSMNCCRYFDMIFKCFPFSWQYHTHSLMLFWSCVYVSVQSTYSDIFYNLIF